jgi:hypothetical protein
MLVFQSSSEINATHIKIKADFNDAIFWGWGVRKVCLRKMALYIWQFEHGTLYVKIHAMFARKISSKSTLSYMSKRAPDGLSSYSMPGVH